MILKAPVLYVKKNTLKTDIQQAKLVAVNVAEPYEAEVYDLMVEDCHEYFANGILVHNCIDGIRYFFVGKWGANASQKVTYNRNKRRR